MDFPRVAAIYAGLFGLLFAVLSAWVIGGRLGRGVVHGDGGDDRMGRRIRAHGNFAEYVPLILLMTALLESRGLEPIWLHALLAPLLIARLIHPLGMLAPVGSPQQFALRGTGAAATVAILAIVSVLLLL